MDWKSYPRDNGQMADTWKIDGCTPKHTDGSNGMTIDWNSNTDWIDTNDILVYRPENIFSSVYFLWGFQ